MPGFNGTGPQGRGSMTGRGLGPCGSGQARGSRGLGRGRMMATGAYRQPTKEDLQAEKKYLEEDLAAINKELKK